MADEPTRTLAPKIDEEFAALFPKLSDEEAKILQAKIDKEGMTESLVVWGDRDDPKHEPNILVDGHNRLGICQKIKKKYTCRYINFSDREAVIRWIYLNQLGRRNLTKEQHTYLLGKYYNANKPKRGQPAKEKSATVADSTKTADEIAKEAKVSTRTVHNAAAYADAVDAMPAADKEKTLAGQGPSRKEVIEGMGWRQTPIKEVIKHPASNIVFAEMQLATVGAVYDALVNHSIPTATNGGERLCIEERAQKHLQEDIERFIRESTEPVKPKAPRKPKSDNGAVDLVWDNWHKAVGSVSRQVDNLFRAHDKLNCQRHKDWLDTWAVLLQEHRDMYTELTGKEAPPISGGTTSGQA